jgi:hypothetical protein
MTTPKDQLGPLADLIGTWTSPQDNPTGLNVISVPSAGSAPNDEGAFTLLARPYRETLTFEVAAPPARNRGGDVDQFVGAVAYKQEIWATDQDKEQLHAENGMFLYLKNKNTVSASATNDEGIVSPAPFSIARSATIPHGVSALLLGDTSEFDGAPHLQVPKDADNLPPVDPLAPVIPDIDTRPKDIGLGAENGYTETYFLAQPDVLGGPKLSTAQFPNRLLTDTIRIRKQKIVHTTSFSLDSNNQGHVSNIPFISERANTPRFRCDMWLETVDNGDGTTMQQLQYSQNIDMIFHKKFGGLGNILWPHVTVNTLTKQCD